MIATRVGYAGGTTENPTYHHLGDHREAVEVTFDPAVVSYDELLDIYWSGQPNHLPPGPDPRVRLGILPHGSPQTRAAIQAKEQLRDRAGDTVHVDIVPDPAFWPAERMHQKFTLQRRFPDLVEAWAATRGGVDAFLASTAAARLNTWLSPYGDEGDLIEAAGLLGMDVEELRQRLGGRG